MARILLFASIGALIAFTLLAFVVFDEATIPEQTPIAPTPTVEVPITLSSDTTFMSSERRKELHLASFYPATEQEIVFECPSAPQIQVLELTQSYDRYFEVVIEKGDTQPGEYFCEISTNDHRQSFSFIVR